MSQLSRRKSPPLPPYRRSIIMDPVKASDFRKLNIIYACEQCSYFCGVKQTCAMGFKTDLHLKKNQDALYNRTGRLAICRFQEID